MLPILLARQRGTISSQCFQSSMTATRSIFLRNQVVKLFHRRGVQIDILDVLLQERDEGSEWMIEVNNETRIEGRGLCNARVKLKLS